MITIRFLHAPIGLDGIRVVFTPYSRGLRFLLDTRRVLLLLVRLLIQSGKHSALETRHG